MLLKREGQAMVEYLLLISIVCISLLIMILLSQQVLVTLYNQIVTIILDHS